MMLAHEILAKAARLLRGDILVPEGKHRYSLHQQMKKDTAGELEELATTLEKDDAESHHPNR